MPEVHGTWYNLGYERIIEMKRIAENRKARHDYTLLEKVEAGVALLGPEVKSLRAGQVNLRDSFARLERGQAILCNMHIAPYDPASRENADPRRARRLLLHRREIRRLTGKVAERGLALVPTRIYFNDKGVAKVELALASGKRSYDRRQTLKRRESEREVARAMKASGRRGPERRE